MVAALAQRHVQPCGHLDSAASLLHLGRGRLPYGKPGGSPACEQAPTPGSRKAFRTAELVNEKK